MAASPRSKSQAPDAELPWPQSPGKALLVTISAVFLAEIVARAALMGVAPPLSQAMEALVEVLAIGGVVLASLLVFVYAPMKRYRVQRDRAEREQWIQASTAKQSGVGLVAIDLEGNLQFVNRTAAAMHGYSPDELLGKHVSVFHSSEQMPSVDAVISQVRETGEFSGELWHIRRDGSTFPTWMRNSLLRDAQHRLVGMIGTARDIIEERSIQAALRESEERLRGILQHSPSVIYLKDLEGRYQLINRRFEELFGITNEEFRGKTDYDLFPEETAISLRKNDQTIESTGRSLLVDEEIPIGDSVYSYLTIKFRMMDADGEGAGVCGISTDISERKRAEEERLGFERQVQHAQKLESLGVLAGGVAHDFNNLLMVILGNAALALQDLAPHAPGRESVKEIEEASHRAAALAKQMLAYSGRGRFVIEPIHLNALVREMTHLLQASVSKKSILRFDLSSGLPAFEGDATQIRQVIMNLITNASEAMGDQGGTISIATGLIDCDRSYLDEMGAALRSELEQPLPEGVYIFFEVTDTGSGMSPEILQRIFEPFFTTKMTGRGLGMAAVLGIVRGHKGLINVKSAVDKGTTFRILLASSQEDSAAAPDQIKRETPNEARIGRGTILVVDDEELVCSVARRMLERSGFSVLTAADGRDAVQVYREHSEEIDCVLLDLTMPYLDGEQVFREMRAIRPEVKAILMSGYDEQEAMERFAGKGLSGFLQKPFQPQSLSEILQGALGDPLERPGGPRDPDPAH